VPTRTGCPILFALITSCKTDLYLPFSVLYTASGKSSLTIGLLVGMHTTSSPYIALNSSSSVRAVPVIPEIFVYILK